MSKVSGNINVCVNQEGCFYHVLGDDIEFYDLESLVRAHPELDEIVRHKKYDLTREFYQKQELFERNINKGE